jgi:hypothetical protein
MSQPPPLTTTAPITNTINTTFVPIVPATTRPAVQAIPRCNIPGCLKPPEEELSFCSNFECEKTIHYLCYSKKVLDKNGLLAVVDIVTNQEKLICTKKCHSKVKKAFVDHPNRLPWNRDGRNGPDDPNNSQKILLDWMLHEGHYSRFRGKNNNGTRKIKFAGNVSKLIADAGIRVRRTPSNVLDKIRHFEDQFRKAHDWANNTGKLPRFFS